METTAKPMETTDHLPGAVKLSSNLPGTVKLSSKARIFEGRPDIPGSNIIKTAGRRSVVVWVTPPEP